MNVPSRIFGAGPEKSSPRKLAARLGADGHELQEGAHGVGHRHAHHGAHLGTSFDRSGCGGSLGEFVQGCVNWGFASKFGVVSKLSRVVVDHSKCLSTRSLFDRSERRGCG